MRGGEDEGAVVGEADGVEMVDMNGGGNAAGVEVKLRTCVYPLPSPHKHTDTSHSNPRHGATTSRYSRTWIAT